MIIAITGRIGAGKSMVGNIVRALGGYVIDADMINAELMTKTSYILEIKKYFPNAVTNMVIDRKKLADIVFNDKNSLIKLNSIAHPLIIGIIMYEASQVTGQNVFVEIPILLDSIVMYFNRIWVVESDIDLRIERVFKRDNVSLERFNRINAAQNQTIKSDIATDIIINNGSEEKLWEEVQKLYLLL